MNLAELVALQAEQRRDLRARLMGLAPPPATAQPPPPASAAAILRRAFAVELPDEQPEAPAPPASAHALPQGQRGPGRPAELTDEWLRDELAGLPPRRPDVATWRPPPM